MDALLDDIAMGRAPSHRLERLTEVMRAESGDRREVGHAQLVAQMCVDVFDHAPQLCGGESPLMQICSPTRQPVSAQQVDSECRAESFDVEATTRATLAQLELGQGAYPPKHRILDTDRGPEGKVTCAIKCAVPSCCDEGFVHREGEERRRSIAADP